jgi:hypothetical protein
MPDPVMGSRGGRTVDHQLGRRAERHHHMEGIMRRRIGVLVAVLALVSLAVSVPGASAMPKVARALTGTSTGPDVLKFKLAPSTPAIAACFPDLQARVEVRLETDRIGHDQFDIHVRGLPPGEDFTVFLLEQPASPFGAAEYIGDFSTNGGGRGSGRFELIVEEAFSSTLVNGMRVRADLNHVGFWFADPAGDDGCLGAGSPVTPFDGDNEAGVQVMNSANALPGAPLPPP